MEPVVETQSVEAQELEAQGVEAHSPLKRRGRPPKFNAAQCQEIINIVREQGLTAKDVATRFGTTTLTIVRVFQKAGLSIRGVRKEHRQAATEAPEATPATETATA